MLIIWICNVLVLHLQRRLGQAVIDILNIQTPARSRRTHNIVINQLNLLRGRPYDRSETDKRTSITIKTERYEELSISNIGGH